jgi:dihydrolipoamide dehydrogenase
MKSRKLWLIVVIAALVGVFYGLDLSQYLSLERLQTLVADNPVQAGVIFFSAYVLITALSLPAAALMTLMGGAVFGLGWGVLLVSFASSLGATLAFLISRTLLRDWVQRRFGGYLGTINRGVEKDGASYLFSLRLIPVIPFFAINAVFGLTPIRAWTFYWVSQLGMLPATFVYVNAGAELGAVEELSAAGILTPGLIGAFVLLALFPYIVKALMGAWQRRRALAPYRAQKPKQFDNNLLVVGAGSGGLVSAYIAAAVKAKVTLIERHQMGGDCLNTGCVPSKALIRSAHVNKTLARAAEFGIQPLGSEVNFPAVMERVQGVVDAIEPHDSVERYTELGVNCVQGEARIVSPWEVEVTGEAGVQRMTAKHIVIASGARPFVPPIPGIEDTGYLTSDSLWQLREQPKRLMVMGAGPIGCELAQAFARLGVKVTLVDMAPRILPREDEDVAAYVAECFAEDGIEVLVHHKTVAFTCDDNDKLAQLETASGEVVEVGFDQLLVAVGRKANSEQFSDLPLGLTPQGTLQVDEYMRTDIPTIYACGDIVGPYQFTHMAAHQAWYAAVNALFGKLRKFKVDYRVVPWATFTDPEVARVGLNEMDAREQNIEVDITRYGIDDLDRAIADGEARGFVKVLTRKGSDKVLGVTIVGYHASDLISEWVLAMKHGIGLNKILGTIHIYPTMAEANKYTAGVWKQANKPEGILRWVEKFHRWNRK